MYDQLDEKELNDIRDNLYTQLYKVNDEINRRRNKGNHKFLVILPLQETNYLNWWRHHRKTSRNGIIGYLVSSAMHRDKEYTEYLEAADKGGSTT